MPDTPDPGCAAPQCADCNHVRRESRGVEACFHPSTVTLFGRGVLARWMRTECSAEEAAALDLPAFCGPAGTLFERGQPPGLSNTAGSLSTTGRAQFGRHLSPTFAGHHHECLDAPDFIPTGGHRLMGGTVVAAECLRPEAWR